MQLEDLPWRDTPFVAFDFETTGRDPTSDRIIEVGIARFEGGEVVDRYQQLVHPGIPLPEEIIRITGIQDEDLAHAPPFAEIADAIAERMQGHVLLAYNHAFDLGFLHAEFDRLGRSFDQGPCLDPFPFVWKHLQIEAKSISNAKLTTAAEHLGIPLDNAHRADHDAEAAGRVLLALDALAELPTLVREMVEVQRMLHTQRTDRFRKGRAAGGSALQGAEVVIGLGASYVYGNESDPIRALILQLPDARDL